MAQVLSTEGRRRRGRRAVLLRLDPAVYEALARWASDELRSTNAQIEFLLRRELRESGRLRTGAAAGSQGHREGA